MSEFAYTDLLPLGDDITEYRLLTTDGLGQIEAGGRTFLTVEPGVLTQLTSEAMRDIAHLLRPSHLEQVRSILDDPEASANDRFVATELLLNANIAAGGVLPSCQDTGTAIVSARKGQYVLTDGDDRQAIARGVFDTYQTSNLRYSQLAPLDMFTEKNTGNNLPAQIEVEAVEGSSYKFLFMAKGGGSANKSYLFQETKALLNPEGLTRFLDEKLRTLGTAACPPYHLAVVIGGTSAEHTLKVAKYASARYLDTLPTSGSDARTRLPRPRVGGPDPRADPRSSGSVPSSVASTSATTSASSAFPVTERPTRSGSPCRAPPTVRRWPRSPRRACSSNASSAIRPASCPTPRPISCRARWSGSISTSRWTRSAPS